VKKSLPVIRILLSALTKTVAEKEKIALFSNINSVYDVSEFHLSFSFIHSCLVSISIFGSR
jgi:hypothetical protein